ncbi:hypothetical protein VTL71DRAFT_416 [Oculimacula yallundae]|uniref:Translation initiation factor 3 N-terminal domain-containing protein n=1 Tax=Oculimacula yallundae TaxID=86028 RepID=A0ABR4D1G9_9HELO
MRSSRCVFSTAAALQRVFIAPIELQTPSRVQTRGLVTLSSQLRQRPHAILNLSQPQRRYVSLHRAEKSRLPRDDEIQAWSVTLVDADGKLTEPRSTRDILSTLDRKTNSLVIVVPGEPGVPPICKILNKQQMRESEKAKLKAARGSGVTQKTMELNWAIGKNDLGHRMDKLRGWLEKGWKVDVVLAGKKKGRKATEEEAEALVKHIRGVLEEVGGRETKLVEGKMLGQLTLYLEGKKAKEVKATSKSGGQAGAGAGVDGSVERGTSTADVKNASGTGKSASLAVDGGNETTTESEGDVEGEKEGVSEKGEISEADKLAEFQQKRRRKHSGWEQQKEE